MDDRRQPIPQLFRNLDRTGIEAQRTERKPASRSRKKTEQIRSSDDEDINDKKFDEPTLFEENVSEPADHVAVSETHNIVVDPDETQAIAWSPATVATSADDEIDNEPVFGRLMGRAFRQKGAQ